MSNNYISLGLMSGTSGDGVDASIIQSDGQKNHKVISDEYFEYNINIFENFHKLREKINNPIDLKKLSEEIDTLEREITIFHAEAVNKILKKNDVDFVGFHGQTIYHNAGEKISKQLGNGKLLSQLVKKDVIFNFRTKDLANNGQGAPLTPIYHQLLAKKLNINPVKFINIGGIINETNISLDNNLNAKDIGPGMCLVDQWIRINSKGKYDNNGSIAKSGTINKIILDQALENFFEHPNFFKQNIKKITNSYDVKDFDLAFVRGLSFEDAAATLIEFTVQIMLPSLYIANKKKEKIILCGGGRKNQFLIERIKKNNIKLELIDNYQIDGDFIESQAFAFLAIRSFLQMPITFPKTTGCNKPSLGGEIVKF